MNRAIILSLAGASCLAFGNFINAQTVATDPVGFTTTTVAAGKTAALSLPFNSVADFSGATSSFTTNTITTTGAGFGSFGPFASNPHVVRILSGTSTGRQFRITSNTADTLTVTPNLTSIAAGDRYQVFPVATLATLFGQTGTGLLTGGDASVVDNVLIRGTSGWLTYYNDGSNWLRDGGGASIQNNTAVLPETGFLLVRRGGTSYAFTALGAVPTTTLVTDLPNNKLTVLGDRFPVALTLNGPAGTPTALNLHLLSGWISNSDVSLADNVLIRGASGWLTYYYDGANWLRDGGGATPQNPPIGIGTSVLVLRRVGSDVTLTQSLPYTL